ncbi:MAG TPA: SgcJ/EcaC family oxidoreductase [Blastocatellia bacterium]|jgi:uncharacterized protein (TIGR02246 family)|nr:SgcJ/EcaC family oxidoreductase [Blastocatellia bacterium]
MFSCIFLLSLAVSVLAMTYNATSPQDNERTIRGIVEESLARLNKGDLTVFKDFWDENADYVGVDGVMLHGRSQIEGLFRKLTPSSGPLPQQNATIEQVRFLSPELAISDGAWTITGVRDSAGKELAPIRGRGFEIFQKKHGRWWIIATREMVIFKGN